MKNMFLFTSVLHESWCGIRMSTNLREVLHWFLIFMDNGMEFHVYFSCLGGRLLRFLIVKVQVSAFNKEKALYSRSHLQYCEIFVKVHWELYRLHVCLTPHSSWWRKSSSCAKTALVPQLSSPMPCRNIFLTIYISLLWTLYFCCTSFSIDCDIILPNCNFSIKGWPHKRQIS